MNKVNDSDEEKYIFANSIMWSFSNGALSISYLVSECKTTIFTCTKCASPIGLHCRIVQKRIVIVTKRRGENRKTYL